MYDDPFAYPEEIAQRLGVQKTGLIGEGADGCVYSLACGLVMKLTVGIIGRGKGFGMRDFGSGTVPGKLLQMTLPRYFVGIGLYRTGPSPAQQAKIGRMLAPRLPTEMVRKLIDIACSITVPSGTIRPHSSWAPASGWTIVARADPLTDVEPDAGRCSLGM